MWNFIKKTIVATLTVIITLFVVKLVALLIVAFMITA